VHSFLGHLLVVGTLQQHPDIGVRKSESPVDVAALLSEWLLGGVESGGPERDRAVEVVGGRGRPPQAAARRPALRTVRKVVTTDDAVSVE
jgi:hypothetical protein